jgi:hypothetical protein
MRKERWLSSDWNAVARVALNRGLKPEDVELWRGLGPLMREVQATHIPRERWRATSVGSMGSKVDRKNLKFHMHQQLAAEKSANDRKVIEPYAPPTSASSGLELVEDVIAKRAAAIKEMPGLPWHILQIAVNEFINAAILQIVAPLQQELTVLRKEVTELTDAVTRPAPVQKVYGAGPSQQVTQEREPVKLPLPKKRVFIIGGLATQVREIEKLLADFDLRFCDPGKTGDIRKRASSCEMIVIWSKFCSHSQQAEAKKLSVPICYANGGVGDLAGRVRTWANTGKADVD